MASILLLSEEYDSGLLFISSFAFSTNSPSVILPKSSNSGFSSTIVDSIASCSVEISSTESTLSVTSFTFCSFTSMATNFREATKLPPIKLTIQASVPRRGKYLRHPFRSAWHLQLTSNFSHRTLRHVSQIYENIYFTTKQNRTKSHKNRTKR